ncbi:capsular polysaccharide synthesis protein [Acinetobacter lwoffii]|uniref:capsular polysaccharide synthesis protein n=1 Tax=Acinetobacter lwoffii TaxID=28090 RepID=UPI0021CD5E23|nr:capsular polysaccharide synthesis protein [Acinetobacter lwoffii]MCU4614790.1 capsular polysaccharide synthesis protein [Acinetobacter lwoffii]
MYVLKFFFKIINYFKLFFFKVKLYFLSYFFLNIQKKIIFSILKSIDKKSNNFFCGNKIEYDYMDNNKKMCQKEIIWICWFQGLDNAPPIVKKCIENIIKFNSDFYQINVISFDNFSNFVAIPDFIVEKVKTKKITLTHFSDILRFALLAKHGGVWIDSTYFTLSALPKVIYESEFFTLKSHNLQFKQWIPEGMWSGNFIKFKKNNQSAQFIYNLFLKYWFVYDDLIDYFLIDYIIAYVYSEDPEFRINVDNCGFFGENVFLLNNVLFNNVNKIDDMKLKADNVRVYKMTYKIGKNLNLKINNYYNKYFL